MGIELSIVYFLAVCAVTAGFWALLIRVANPKRPRLGGVYMGCMAVAYLVTFYLLSHVWQEFLLEWYGRWPGFTFGIYIGVPALVIAAGSELGMVGTALFTLVSGRIPAWIASTRKRPVWGRMGIGVTIVIILLGVGAFVLHLILRKP